MKFQTQLLVKNFNRMFYALLILAGISFMIQRDISNSVIYWGLALVFDPFDIKTPFDKRPLYQRIWLLVHLTVTLILFICEMAGIQSGVR